MVAPLISAAARLIASKAARDTVKKYGAQAVNKVKERAKGASQKPPKQSSTNLSVGTLALEPTGMSRSQSKPKPIPKKKAIPKKKPY